MRCHDADSHERTLRPHDGDGPGETGRRDILTKMDFDVVKAARRELALCCMQVLRRQSEAATTLDAVACAASEDHKAGSHSLIAGHRGRSARVECEISNARPDSKLGTRG